MFENDSNIITLKIKYSTDEQSKTRILEYIKNYNNVLRFTYNRLHENKDLKTKEITILQKTMNNIFVDSHFKNSAIFDSKSLLGKEKVIFGGKKLFIDRCQNKITKDEFQLKKLRPIYSVGESPRKGNRKFLIINENHIIFKPNQNEKFLLEINPSKNYQKYLLELSDLANQKKIPIDFKLDLDYVYISFDLNKLKSERIISYEIKIENSPLNIGTDLNGLNIKNMKLQSTPKVNDFSISFKDDSTNQALYDWVKSISKINENTVFDTVECRVLTKPYPYKSKKKRLVKKWWNKHSEIRVYKNVKLNFED